jgi:hypothetical protein
MLTPRSQRSSPKRVFKKLTVQPKFPERVLDQGEITRNFQNYVDEDSLIKSQLDKNKIHDVLTSIDSSITRMMSILHCQTSNLMETLIQLKSLNLK